MERYTAAHYAFYQQTYLELLTPEGQHLEYVGKTLRQEREEDQSYSLRGQVALVACLLGGVQDEIQLSLPAVLALTNLFCRMQEEMEAAVMKYRVGGIRSEATIRHLNLAR